MSERRTRRRKALRFVLRTVQLVLLASPIFVAPTFAGWVLWGVLLAVSIGLEVWAERIAKRLVADR